MTLPLILWVSYPTNGLATNDLLSFTTSSSSETEALSNKSILLFLKILAGAFVVRVCVCVGGGGWGRGGGGQGRG